LRWEEEVEATGLEEEVEATRLEEEELDEDGGHNSERKRRRRRRSRRGTRTVWGCTMRGWAWVYFRICILTPS
jgi:hypothetical protein